MDHLLYISRYFGSCLGETRASRRRGVRAIVSTWFTATSWSSMDPFQMVLKLLGKFQCYIYWCIKYVQICSYTMPLFLNIYKQNMATFHQVTACGVITYTQHPGQSGAIFLQVIYPSNKTRRKNEYTISPDAGVILCEVSQKGKRHAATLPFQLRAKFSTALGLFAKTTHNKLIFFSVIACTTVCAI